MENVNASGDQSQQTGGQATDGDQTNNNNVSYESHRKLLGEKKRLQDEFSAMRDELENLRSANLKAEGKKDELLERYKKQSEQYKATLEEKEKKYRFKLVSESIKAKAIEMGCKKPDHLLKLGDFSAVSVDDEYQVDSQALLEALEKSKSEFDYLFDGKSVKVHDIAPNQKPGEEAPMDFSKMTSDQRMKLLVELEKKKNMR